VADFVVMSWTIGYTSNTEYLSSILSSGFISSPILSKNPEISMYSTIIPSHIKNTKD